MFAISYSEITQLLLDEKDGYLAFLEPKGTMQATPTGFLIYGYDQCTNGEVYLKSYGIIPANSYVSAVSFGRTSLKVHRHTRIYISDELQKYESYSSEYQEEFSDVTFVILERLKIWEYTADFFIL